MYGEYIPCRYKWLNYNKLRVQSRCFLSGISICIAVMMTVLCWLNCQDDCNLWQMNLKFFQMEYCISIKKLVLYLS